jgi:peptide chain release factor 1
MESLEKTQAEYNKLLEQLSNPGLISDSDKFEKLTRRKKFLEKMIEKQKEIADVKKQIEENKAIISGVDTSELVTIAQSESSFLQGKEKKLEKELSDILKEENSPAKTSCFESVLIEIRAGTGGDEAALFAGDLYKIYSRFAIEMNWGQKVLDSHPTDLGGFKEVIFELKSTKQSREKDVFSIMKYEGGVHRVQRIPKTEKTGRVHTSTATVAVLPKPKPTEIKIKPGDLKMTYCKASGPGGQYVNKTESAVRIVHLPTGLTVASQSERNQLQNKENAMSILAARLYEMKEQEQLSKIAGKRKSQIGGAKRAEKIRTYNFPQDRVTDHRIKKSWHDIEGIMEGKIDKMIEALQKSEE